MTSLILLCAMSYPCGGYSGCYSYCVPCIPCPPVYSICSPCAPATPKALPEPTPKALPEPTSQPVLPSPIPIPDIPKTPKRKIDNNGPQTPTDRVMPTPIALVSMKPGMCKIIIHAPKNSLVYINGQLSQKTDSVREFVSYGILDDGLEYPYEINVNGVIKKVMMRYNTVKEVRFQ